MDTDTLPAPVTRAAQPAPEKADRADDRRTGERLGLAALLVSTALLNLWGLGASGWANSFRLGQPRSRCGSAGWWSPW